MSRSWLGGGYPYPGRSRGTPVLAPDCGTPPPPRQCQRNNLGPETSDHTPPPHTSEQTNAGGN